MAICPALPHRTIGNAYIHPVLDLQKTCKILQAISYCIGMQN